MGSRKRRRERDSSRRHRSSSGSRSRSPIAPIAPPPPSISTSRRSRERDEKDRRRSRDRDEKDERRRSRDRDEKDDRHRHRHKGHKESKQKHRERSRSPGRPRRSKHEPDNHSDSSDCVEVPLPPPAPVISKPTKSPSPIPENGAGDSLSVQETNKLRAKLGLKPLQIDSNDGASSSSSKKKSNAAGEQMHKDEWGEFYHKPANNLSEKLQAEKLREKFRQNKQKRALETKLKSTKTLGESDEDDDISKWVNVSREKEKLKAEAQRRAKILEEMDDEFGVGELIQEETRRERKKIYSEQSLKGLKVNHDLDAFTEGKSIILTLKDHDVLDEKEGDTLENVNLIDDERYRKNIDNKKLNPNQYGYNVFEDDVDEFGNPLQRDVLSKYDEEIGKAKKKSFKIGQNVEEEIAQKRRLQEIKSKLAGKRLETLNEPLIAPASDTYTETELATFKKPKKKIKKLRKKLKAEDLEPLPSIADSLNHRKRDPNRHLSDVLDTDDVPDFKEEIKVEEEEDIELEHILSKARRLKQVEAVKTMSLDPNKIKAEVKAEPDSDDDASTGTTDFITLNQTAEFCRTLGDIPTYGQSGNRGVDANEIMDIDSEHEDVAEPMEEEEQITGTWNSVNPDLEQKPCEETLEVVSEVAILDEEPDVSTGMGAALKLALSKGYLEKEESNRPSNTRMAHLQAKNYSIEDKTHGEDDKFNRRDRFHSGPTGGIVDKMVNISIDPEYELPPGALTTPADQQSKTEAVYRRAEDVVSSMLAKGFLLGKDAVNKAKALDEKHQLSSTASAKVASIDQKMGLTEKITIGTAIVNDKVKEVDAKFQVSEKTKSALAVAEQKVSSAGSAIMKNRYVFTSAAWVTGAFSKVAKAAGEVGHKAQEKMGVAEEEEQQPNTTNDITTARDDSDPSKAAAVGSLAAAPSQPLQGDLKAEGEAGKI